MKWTQGKPGEGELLFFSFFFDFLLKMFTNIFFCFFFFREQLPGPFKTKWTQGKSGGGEYACFFFDFFVKNVY